MMGREHQANGEFGFARGARTGSKGASAQLRLVHAKDEQTLPAAPKTFARPEAKVVVETPPAPRAQPPKSTAGGQGWVVRPKAARPSPPEPKPRPLRARKPRKPAIHAGGPAVRAATPRTEASYKRWAALAVASMIYVVGIAGLWSMVQTFEAPPAPALTPAGESGALPPIDDEVDVRDARLDGPFIPKFKPQLPLDAGDDVASSDLQKQG